MAEYFFRPSSIEHPTKGEKDLLFRRLGHDLQGCEQAVAWIAESLVESYDGAFAERLLALTRHQAAVTTAVSKLGLYGRISAADFSVRDVLADLAAYMTKRESRMSVVNDSFEIEEVKVLNYGSVIYTQLFNFARNAQEAYSRLHGGGADWDLALIGRVVTLPEELHGYLGPNTGIYGLEDPFIEISVTDDAEGITEKSLPKVFEPGWSSNGHNRGIGLALTDMVCGLIHGFVRVESVEGEGSTFTLYFPQERKSVER